MAKKVTLRGYDPDTLYALLRSQGCDVKLRVNPKTGNAFVKVKSCPVPKPKLPGDPE